MVDAEAQGDRCRVLRPVGPLDHFEIDPLLEGIRDALSLGDADIEVDLSSVTLLSATAVGHFLRTAASCEAKGVCFRLRGADGLQLQVLHLLDAGHLHTTGAGTLAPTGD